MEATNVMKSILTIAASLALSVSGFAQTRSVIVNTSGAVQSPTNFWSADASNARTGLGLGTAATNPATAFQPSSLSLSNISSGNGGSLTNLTAANITGTVGLASNVTGTIAISNGGSGATTASAARTNLGLGTTNQVGFDSVQANDFTVSDGGTISFEDTGSIEFGNAAGPTRTNLGLGASWLTSTNSPVFVDTNGEVVSPANFWEVAPITTTFIESQPITNSTTNIVPARYLHIHSLATNIFNVTNTIVLPTNTATFSGDTAIIVHQGPTNSLTRVRSATSTNNLVTMSRHNESLEFVYHDGDWVFSHNPSFTEPVYFAGPDSVANAAISRTNLGLGTTNNVEFAYVEAPYFFIGDGTNGIVFETDEVAAITRTNLGIGAGATNTVSFGKIRVPDGSLAIEDPVNDASIITFPIDTDPVVLGADYWNHAAVRTSLGLGSGITTNLVLKNGSNQDTYMNFSNGILIYGSTVAP
jgi:hypothetical protein